MISSDSIGDAAFDKLLELQDRDSDSPRPRYLELTFRSDDRRIQLAQDVLSEQGWEFCRNDDGAPARRKTYKIHRSTILDDADWNGAHIMTLFAADHTAFGGDSAELDDGTPVLSSAYANSNVTASSATARWIGGCLIPDRIRSQLEKRFPDVRSIEILASEPGTAARSNPTLVDWPPDSERWWKLWSARSLPSVNARTHLIAIRGGAVVDPRYDGAVRIADDDDGLAIAHYSASDLTTLGDFDIAITHERFGPHDLARGLVVSRRFWDWSIEHGIEFNRGFIRIDDE
ncbi:MAG: hypothetical protein AAFQ71_02755 [Planctomycetota bacterium]